MATSLSGYPVLDSPPWGDKRLGRGTIPGTKVRITTRQDVLPLFLHIGAAFNAEVKPLGADTWGYNYRRARMASGYSDHAAGVAVDYWASTIGAHKWPPNMTKAQASKVLGIILRYKTSKGKRIFGWGAHSSLGGDYTQTASNDPMHVFLLPGVTAADIADVMKRLRINPNGTTRPYVAPTTVTTTTTSTSVLLPTAPALVPIKFANLAVGKRNADVRAYQRALRNYKGGKFAALNPAGVTGQYGKETVALTRAVRKDMGLRASDTPTRPMLKRLGFTVA